MNGVDEKNDGRGVMEEFAETSPAAVVRPVAAIEGVSGTVRGAGKDVGSEIIEALELIEAESVFNFLLDDPDIAEILDAGSPLNDVVRFFGLQIQQMGLSESLFFKNEALKADFVARLKEFKAFVDEEIEDVNRILLGYEDYSNFSEGWQKNVRKACYYAFFIHYGAKRKGEQDAKDKPKDYVYHVVRSGFNCLIRKMRFLDERTLIAAILHDTREDYAKGLFGLLHVENPDFDPAKNGLKGNKGMWGNGKEKALSRGGEILIGMGEFEAGLDGEIGEINGEEEVSLSEILDMVTKSTSVRTRALLEIFVKILRFKNPAKRFSAIKAFLVKIADRLDNFKTFTVGTEDLTRRQTEDETVYIYLAFCKLVGMTNVADFFYDYVAFKDRPEIRKRYTDRRRAAERKDPQGRYLDKEERARGRFKREFNEKLCMELGGTVVEGIHYVLEFRDLGHRHENPEEAQKAFESGNYAKAFRGFIVFHPVGDNVDLADLAKQVFRDIFDKNLSRRNRNRGEIKGTALGRMVIENGGAGEHLADYGVGVWCAFDSQEDSINSFLGDVHAAYFCNDSEARERILGLLANLEGRVDHLWSIFQLGRFYEQKLFRADPDEINYVGEWSRLRVRKVCADLLGVGDEKEREATTPDGYSYFDRGGVSDGTVVGMERLADNLVMSLFMTRTTAVEVNVNGFSKEVVVPDDAVKYEDAPLVFASPFLLGKPVSSKAVTMTRGVVDAVVGKVSRGWKRLFLRSGDNTPALAATAVNYNLHLRAPFSRGRFKDQTAFVEPLMRKYRESLLEDSAFRRPKKKKKKRSGGRQ